MHGTKKGLDPNLRPEWLVIKSQKLVEKSRIEKEGIDPSRQGSQIIDQNKYRTKKRDQKI